MSAGTRAAPSARGSRPASPVALVINATFGLVAVTLFSWFLGTVIEVVGMHTIWDDEGAGHSVRMVREDLGYIDAAPRSLLVEDTSAFARQITEGVYAAYDRVGALALYQRLHGPAQPAGLAGQATRNDTQRLESAMTVYLGELTRWLLVSMFVLQDTLLRLAIALFALPAFVLACILGGVDGLVRRDLRRWGGGRESSFVYHHAKRMATWSLSGGFALYLAWPFGGFNPSYMVLIFTALVAFTLSTTLAAFKKYV